MSSSTPFLGCKISLISKSEIRYEGILYTIDPKESTIALAKGNDPCSLLNVVDNVIVITVKSFGTEDRPCDRPVAARDETFEYIIFRASDIKDLIVDDPPSAPITDPAIISVNNTKPASPTPPEPRGVRPHVATGASSAAFATLSSVTGDRGMPLITPQSVGSRSGASTPAASSGARKSPLTLESTTRPANAWGELQPRFQTRSREASQQQPGRGPIGQGRLNQGTRPQRQGQVGTGRVEREVGGQRNNVNMHDTRRVPTQQGYPAQRGFDNRNNFQARNSNYGPRLGHGLLDNRYNQRGPASGGFRQDFRGPQRGGYQAAGRGPMQGGRGSGPRGQPMQPRGQPLKIDGEFDFEKANEDFLKLEEKLKAVKVSGDSGAGSDSEVKVSSDAAAASGDGGSVTDAPVSDADKPSDELIEEPRYDKAKSFFDTISCEALEREKG